MADQDNQNNSADAADASDGSRHRGARNRKTTPDQSFARAGGRTTILSGISGASLSYLPGDIVDGAYQLTKLLGRGGMGAVFACRHLALDREYALKLLSGNELSGQAWSRFQIEAKALARLNHPSIVGIYNMGIDKEQCPYYVMDLLSGQALDSLIDKSGPMPVAEALDVFIQVADALASAHAQGIIHRDIKPSNLMLSTDEKNRVTGVKLVDFGIARLSKQGAVVQSQTATGLVFGTPFYMSPEQCEGTRVDERSDVYSLGCTLFETLTGQPPFVGDSAFQTFMLHQTQEAPSLTSRGAGQDFAQSLEQAVAKMLSKSPDDRYQAMTKLKHDLERIKAGKPIMAEGLINTIAPNTSTGRRTASNQRRDRADQASGEAVAGDGIGEFAPSEFSSQPAAKKIAMVMAVLFVIGAGWFAQSSFLSHGTKTGPAKKSENIEWHPGKENPTDDVYHVDMGLDSAPVEKLRSFGATPKELEQLTNGMFTDVSIDENTCRSILTNLSKNKSWAATKFMTNGVFHFPKNVIIGSIRIGNSSIVPATGDIAAPANVDAFLYLITPTKESLQLLDKFAPTDLTGIAMVFDKPDLAIKTVSKWKRLKDLMFFNPILKAMPSHSETWDESKITDTELPSLKQFTGLRSLGLCHLVSGPAILQSHLLENIECIRLKRIEQFEPLLKALPQYPNLKEVYLMHQETTDPQLKLLAQMKNLQKLTILRAHLTINSLRYFQKMPALKELCLDRNDWTDEQKTNFQKGLPHCAVTYDKVVDCQYWDVLPE